jgi:hypothetical protein
MINSIVGSPQLNHKRVSNGWCIGESILSYLVYDNKQPITTFAIVIFILPHPIIFRVPS